MVDCLDKALGCILQVMIFNDIFEFHSCNPQYLIWIYQVDIHIFTILGISMALCQRAIVLAAYQAICNLLMRKLREDAQS